MLDSEFPVATSLLAAMNDVCFEPFNPIPNSTGTNPLRNCVLCVRGRQPIFSID
jgi:hypothetical protein